MPESRHRRRRGGNAPGGRSATGARLAVGSRGKRTNYFYLIVSAVIAILVIGSFAVSGITGLCRGKTSAGSSDKYVDGVGVQQDLMVDAKGQPARNHVDGKTIKYNTIPPTSGDHWSQPASCGFYEQGLPDEQAVHNLEHGAIVISYNLSDPSDVDTLRRIVENIDLSKIWGVTRFYDKIEQGTVAVAAWSALDTMQGVDQGRIEKFFKAYAGRLGPEKSTKGIGIPC